MGGGAPVPQVRSLSSPTCSPQCFQSAMWGRTSSDKLEEPKEFEMALFSSTNPILLDIIINSEPLKIELDMGAANVHGFWVSSENYPSKYLTPITLKMYTGTCWMWKWKSVVWPCKHFYPWNQPGGNIRTYFKEGSLQLDTGRGSEALILPPLATAHLQRCALLLSVYHYQIEFRLTQAHANADVWSALPPMELTEPVIFNWHKQYSSSNCVSLSTNHTKWCDCEPCPR